MIHLRVPGVILLTGFLGCPGLWLQTEKLSTKEDEIVRAVDADSSSAAALLERIVDINSGTFNAEGVSNVASILERELQDLGFTTRRIPKDSIQRGPSLIAERKGHRGKRVLLIGHMDTVFEPSSPFQKFERHGDTATGPGAADMKGGLVVILSALKALNHAGVLGDATITVFLTGDEESPGDPISIARKEFIEAGRNSDAILSFEEGMREDGKTWVTTARRGATDWELRVQAKAGHSSQIFAPEMGDGAIFEISRILARFHDTLREPNMTYSVGLVLGGSNIKLTSGGDASVSGKVNIVPGQALALGDIRALTPEQLSRVKQKIESIVAASLQGTRASIEFDDKYPPMAPSPGNVELLRILNEVNARLGAPLEEALDPMKRGAGDASFIAQYAPALDGLGAVGWGIHAPGETVELSSMPLQTKRVALLVYKLTQ